VETPLPDDVPAPPDTAPALADVSAVQKRRIFPMTDERKRLYIEGLRKSASHRYAAMNATPNGDAAKDKGDIGFAYSTFLRLRKTDLEFAAACDEALNEALGKLEESVLQRAFKPDVREQWDAKTGALIGRSEGWMPANTLARAILARHNDEWVDKSKREVTGTINVNDSGGAGANYNIRIDDVKAALTHEETTTLMGLLSKLEEYRQLQQATPSEQRQLTDQRGQE
jgi:hypothetical protein